MSTKLEGSCFCGAIHYQSESEHPVSMISGDGGNYRYPAEAEVFAMVGVPTDSFRIKGLRPTVFEYRALDGDVALRSFCPQCGTTLFAEFESDPKMIYVRTITSANWLTTDHGFDTAEATSLRQPLPDPRQDRVSNVLQIRSKEHEVEAI